MKKKIHNRKELKDIRKLLRSKLTSAEAFLWTHLQDRQLENRKFRRQHSILNYVVDFYCAEEKLIVELDGEVHMNPTAEEQDRNRDEELESMGFTILRFENKMVFDNLDSVLKEISDQFKSYNHP